MISRDDTMDKDKQDPAKQKSSNDRRGKGEAGWGSREGLSASSMPLRRSGTAAGGRCEKQEKSKTFLQKTVDSRELSR